MVGLKLTSVTPIVYFTGAGGGGGGGSSPSLTTGGATFEVYFLLRLPCIHCLLKEA
ncbi:MAG: hypothetical protein IPN13_14480 [Bacteroidetes bacterium]|nr:hypothetical protein [Bacteroidota bacterium]